MMQITQGGLVLVGLNTPTPKVFFNGVEVAGVASISTEWEHDEHRVKLRVTGADDVLYMQLIDAGVIVKKGKK